MWSKFIKFMVFWMLMFQLSFILYGCKSTGEITQATPIAPTVTMAPTTPTVPPFEDKQVYNLEDVETTVTYSVGEIQPSSNFDRTDKYRIEDYGFFQITAEGLHDGQQRNADEAGDPGYWAQVGDIIRADLNGDGWEDFFYSEMWEGSRDAQPNSYLWAFYNDGNGHFTPEKIGCIGYGDLDLKTDPNHECGFVSHWQRPIVADFNGDGLDDFYKTSILYLSGDDGHENKSFQLPAFQFTQYHDQPGQLSGAWAHDNHAADADGDGDIDIFAPFTGDRYNAGPGWTMMFNDGNGVFTSNHNFPDTADFTHGADGSP